MFLCVPCNNCKQVMLVLTASEFTNANDQDLTKSLEILRDFQYTTPPGSERHLVVVAIGPMTSQSLANYNSLFSLGVTNVQSADYLRSELDNVMDKANVPAGNPLPPAPGTPSPSGPSDPARNPLPQYPGCPSNKPLDTFDLAFLVDMSSDLSLDSAAEDRNLMEVTIVSLLQVFEKSNLNFRTAVAIYASEFRARSEFSTYKNVAGMANAVRQGLNLEGTPSNLPYALERFKEEVIEGPGARPGVAKVAVVFSVGTSDLDDDQVSSSALALRNSGVNVISVGIYTDTPVDQLQRIGIPVTHFSDLTSLVSDLGQLILSCPRPGGGISFDGPINSFPEDPARNPNDIVATCRNLDVAFIIDTSSAIDPYLISSYRFFMKHVALFVDDAPNLNARFAVVQTYQGIADIRFGFRQYSNNIGAIAAMETYVDFRGGRSNMSTALRDTQVMLRERFQQNRAVVVVLTPADSDDQARRAAEDLRGQGFDVVAIILGSSSSGGLPLAANFTRLLDPFVANSADLMEQMAFEVAALVVQGCPTSQEDNKVNAIPKADPGPSCQSLDVVFVVDVSANIQGTDVVLVQFLMEKIIQELSKKRYVRTAVIEHSLNFADVKFDFDIYGFDVRSTVLAIQTDVAFRGGASNLPEALLKALQRVLSIRSEVPKAPARVVVIGPGTTAIGTKEESLTKANDLKVAGFPVVCVGLGDLDEQALREMSSFSNFINLNEKEDHKTQLIAFLNTGAALLVENILEDCKPSVEIFTTPEVPLRSDLSTTKPTRPSTTIPQFSNTRKQRITDAAATLYDGCREVDVMFVVDSSYHVTGDSPAMFLAYKALMMDTLEALHVSGVVIQFGLVTYGYDGRVIYDFDDVYNRERAMASINELQYQGTPESFLEVGMKVAMENIFRSNKNRFRAPDFFFIVTSGRVQDESYANISNIAREMYPRAHVVALVPRTLSKGQRNILANIVWEDGFILTADRNPETNLNEVIKRMGEPCRVRIAPEPKGKCGRVDLAIAVDSSSSMRGDFSQNWNRIVLFVTGLLQSMQDVQADVNIAVIRFSSFAETVVFFDHARSIPSTVDNISERLLYAPGNTGLANAFKEVRRNFREGGARSDATSTLLLITDGNADPNTEDSTYEKAWSLTNEGVKIISLAVGDSMEGIAVHVLNYISQGKDNVVISSFSSLPDHMEHVTSKLCPETA